MNTIEIPFREAAPLIKAAFPSAKGRRPVKVQACYSHTVADYWSEGSRNYTRFVELGTLNVLPSEAIPMGARQKMANPFNLPIADVLITDGFCIIENVIFRGKDLGFRVYVSKPRMLAMQKGDPLNLVWGADFMREIQAPSEIIPQLTAGEP